MLVFAGDTLLMRPVRQLELAVRRGDIPRVQQLLDQGVDPDRTTNVYRSPPIRTRNVRMLRVLLEGGADPDLPDVQGLSAIGAAASFTHGGLCDAILVLLEYGANPDVRATNGTVVENVVRYGAVTYLQALIDSEYDVAAADPNGNTLLWQAVRYDSVEMVNLLLKHGVDPLHRDPEGKTARDYAIICEAEKTAALLLQAEQAASQPRP